MDCGGRESKTDVSFVRIIEYSNGTIFNFGNIKFHLLDTLRIIKMYVRKIHHPGAWEPYLSPRLYLASYDWLTEIQLLLCALDFLKGRKVHMMWSMWLQRPG